jgi:hypothetical protein
VRVDDLDVGGPAVALRPLEADPPLIIDADAVLTLPISAQRFEPVARQRGEVPQRRRRVETVQLQLGRTLTRAFAVVNYEQAVEPFRQTDRLSESERAMLMGGACAKTYGWSPKKS